MVLSCEFRQLKVGTHHSVWDTTVTVKVSVTWALIWRLRKSLIPAPFLWLQIHLHAAEGWVRSSLLAGDWGLLWVSRDFFWLLPTWSFPFVNQQECEESVSWFCFQASSTTIWRKLAFYTAQVTGLCVPRIPLFSLHLPSILEDICKISFVM